MAKDADLSDKPTQVNPLQLFNAIYKEETVARRGFMFVQIHMIKVAVQAMVDTGMTHNFVSDQEVQQLGFALTKDSSQIKVVNSKAKSIGGVAREVPLKVGDWQGLCNFIVVPLDDF